MPIKKTTQTKNIAKDMNLNYTQKEMNESFTINNCRRAVALKFFENLILISVLSGCAISNSTSTGEPLLTVLTQQQIDLLNNNGFGNGIWSNNCNNSKSTKEVINQSKNILTITTFNEGKKVSYDFIYEVNKISKGVLQIKTKTADRNEIQNLSSRISGFLNGKRMTFDYKIFFVSGSNSGKEITIFKDGYEVKTNSDGTKDKGNVSSQFYKCN